MREIKFRAWVDQDDEYLEDYTSSIWFDYWGFITDGVTVEQYTGLKDKNGVEIYEGDIIADGKGLNGVVRYCVSISSFLAYVGEHSYFLNEGNLNAKITLTYSHVIGNIHETPELLNG